MKKYKRFGESVKLNITDKLEKVIKDNLKEFNDDKEKYTVDDIIKEIERYFQGYSEKQLSNMRYMGGVIQSDTQNMPSQYRKHNLFAILTHVWKQVIKDNF